MTFSFIEIGRVPIVILGFYAVIHEAQGSAVFQFENQSITVPDGFIVEKIAGYPLTSRPITVDFDEQGRLYVAESSGSNDSVEIQLKEKPHSILRLEDSNGDGRFDKRTVFADNMMFPEGTLWHDGSLYVTAPPEIWKLTDTDDDGIADKREVWYNPGTLTNCANDLHGPYLGLDGWIYWCKGAFEEQKHTLTTGEEFVSRAAHIFRRHPNGGGVEVVMTGGMDNPVELAFTPGGERIFSSTFFQQPSGGRRDGLAHAIYGGTYGKIHGVINSHPRTGDVLPVLTHLGPAAACALMRYESGRFGEEYRDNLFSSSFNLNKITRHELVKEGATYRTIDTDFMVSDNADFHPTHIEEDADGSLIVVDTGGWYKLCCPTSQLRKPDVYGGIYRIRKTGMKALEDPRGLDLDWKGLSPNELANLLEDERFSVRKRAVDRLARDGGPAIASLKRVLGSSDSVVARLGSVWALTRIDQAESRRAIIDALDDADESVRQAAIHSAGLWRDPETRSRLEKILLSGTSHNRRAAAEALGRIGDSRSAEALLRSGGEFVDRILEHSIIYALIEINEPARVRQTLNASNPNTRRIALIALDQMPSGDLKAESVVRLLGSPELILQKTAEWIVSRHSDWGGALADYFRSRLDRSVLSKDEGDQIRLRLVEMLKDPSIQQLVAEGLSSERDHFRRVCLLALKNSRLRKLPNSWIEPLAALIGADNPELDAAIDAARSLSLGAVGSDSILRNLESASRDLNVSKMTRLRALEALASTELRLDSSQIEFLGESLGLDQSLAMRSSAVKTLSRAKLTVAQLIRVADFLEGASPLQLKPLLSAFEAGSDEALGFKLIDSLESADARESLSSREVRPILKSYPESVQKKAVSLFERLDKSTEEQATHLEHLLATLPEGNIRRGQEIFNSPQMACNACHAIGYLGGTLGPDLTRIGQIRTERDLLEAVVYPSASFVRSYETLQVTTTTGTNYLGILKEETDQEIELLVGIGVAIKLAREEIENMTPGEMSLMPTGLTASLSKQELADLIAFLKSTTRH